MMDLNNKETVQEDDWGLALEFHLFAQHEPRKVYLPKKLTIPSQQQSITSSSSSNNNYFLIDCVESLTPVDMMNLSSSVHDATGHCVWTGAFLLIEALPMLGMYFGHKRVLELGCGTGVASIALFPYYYHHTNSDIPLHVCMTDADPDALELCRRNCKRNQFIIMSPDGDDDNDDDDDKKEQQQNCSLHILTWGQSWPENDPFLQTHSFHTVFAADVLYDIGMLESLFSTAHQACVDSGGFFILSHVPRACYNSRQGPVPDLEGYIVQRAETEFDFDLQSVVRPPDIIVINDGDDKPNDALNSMTLQEMQDIGAAILIFKKKLQEK